MLPFTDYIKKISCWSSKKWQ